LVALHGFNDYSKAFAMPGRYLSHRNIAVYAYDQRGFGNAPQRGSWAGDGLYSSDLKDFISQLRVKYGRIPVHVLGESMGAAVAISAMTSESPPDADGAILSAPAVWSRDSMPWYQRALLAVAASFAPSLTLTGEGLRIQASDNIVMLRELGRDPLVIKATRVDAIDGLANLMDQAQARAAKLKQPLLILYGQRDEVIPKQPILRLLESLPPELPRWFRLYPSGYHLLLRDLHAETTWADIAGWVKRMHQNRSGPSTPASGVATPSEGRS
jgi:alpha-beta hydrolase superfamily lysophospholipase